MARIADTLASWFQDPDYQFLLTLVPLAFSLRESLARPYMPAAMPVVQPMTYSQALAQYQPSIQTQMQQAEAQMMQQAKELARQGWLGQVPQQAVLQESLRSLQASAPSLTAGLANQTASDVLRRYVTNLDDFRSLAARNADLLERSRAAQLQNVGQALQTGVQSFWQIAKGPYQIYPLFRKLTPGAEEAVLRNYLGTQRKLAENNF